MKARYAFIKKVYSNLLLAVLGFIGFEVLLFKSGIAFTLLTWVAQVNWLIILGLFMVVGWVATRMAASAQSLSTQYLALGIYTLAEALIFAPILYIAEYYTGGGVIESAAIATLIGCAGLTLIVFTTNSYTILMNFTNNISIRITNTISCIGRKSIIFNVDHLRIRFI